MRMETHWCNICKTCGDNHTEEFGIQSLNSLNSVGFYLITCLRNPVHPLSYLVKISRERGHEW